ncbi:MAG: hypothetical protein N3G20_04535, partial [Verrucomicrobiae bacterium]|nr:hypothetical protein [Verrucomicrobiae bacterium]
MAVRSILQHRLHILRAFGKSAQSPGFAAELAVTLRELQQHGFSPSQLRALAARFPQGSLLGDKLHDLAVVADAYVNWLSTHRLHDPCSLLALATEALRASSDGKDGFGRGCFTWAGMWLDGFAELTPSEIDLVTAILPFCKCATLAFCVDVEAIDSGAWHSTWAVVGRTVRGLVERIRNVPGLSLKVEVLPRNTATGRFARSPLLATIEDKWEPRGEASHFCTRESVPGTRPSRMDASLLTVGQPVSPPACRTEEIRIVRCTNQYLEVVAAAREILEYVRNGGRFREAAVLTRSLTTHADIIRGVFTHYEIPFFLDRRESVSHHPLVELTRATLRAVAFDRAYDELMAALKTGLVPIDDEHLARIENEALAQGWHKQRWLGSSTPGQPASTSLLNTLGAIAKPFVNFRVVLDQHDRRPTGAVLVEAIRQFWSELHIPERLVQWSSEPLVGIPGAVPPEQLHIGAWEELNDMLDDVLLAFGDTELDLRDWITILESGFENLTVGLIPPALDQVLVGAVDRSRNQDLALVVVLGMNASLFPASPPKPNV